MVLSGGAFSRRAKIEEMSAAARNLQSCLVHQFEVSLSSRDRLQLSIEVDAEGLIVSSKLSGTGCSEMLELLQSTRPQLSGQLSEVPLPSGAGHAAILMRELLLRAKGQWNFPYQEEELCHCRAISTRKVDDAIIGGCHSVDAVKRATSASTSCGTCRWDIESILKCRLAERS